MRKKLMAWLLCALFAWSLALPAWATETARDHDSDLQVIYNDQNGLPGGIANDIAQTADGVLWVGTYGGLYRYNGRAFRWMNEFETIKNVNCLYVDDSDRLWIGTNDSGVALCVDERIVGILGEEEGLSADSVRCVTQSGPGRYYVGTTGALAVVELGDDQVLTVAAQIPQVVYTWSLAADGQGRVAAVTDEGALFYVEGDKVLDRVPCPTEGELFTCCMFAPDGTLYAGTSGSEIFVYRVEVTGTALTRERVISCEGVTYLNALVSAPDGSVMVCAYNGIGSLDPQGRFQTIRAPHFSDSVGHMIFDYQDNLWFTSSRLGLLKLCRSPFTEVYGKAGLEEQVVNTITRWQGKLYFGTDSGLDAAWDDLSAPVEDELTEALAGVRIRCLMADSQGDMWICTSGQGVWHATPGGGVTVYNSATGTQGDWFRSALELSDGTVALAGDSGVTFVREDAIVGTLGSENGLANPKVLCMLELPGGILMAGTDGNGIAVIRDRAVERVLGRENGLSSEVILRLVEDPEGALIVTSNGLCFTDKEGNVRALDSFPYFNNYDVVPSADGKLFVASSAGVYVVDRQALLAGEELEYTLLDAQQGLRSTLTANAWNYVDQDAGTLYLAGSSGVTGLDMEQYVFTHDVYHMNLRQVTADGEVYPLEPEIGAVLPRGAKRVVLEPEIVNYSTSDPDVSLFLEGFDLEPRVMPLSEVGEVVYTNLSPGTYTFHLAVLDEGGEVLSERSYLIEKEKAIYDLLWFRLCVGALGLLLVVRLTWRFFRRRARRAMEEQRRELELANRRVEMSNEAILTIARTVDAKDPSTSQHSFRVSEYSVLIAQRLGLPPESCEEIRKAALLHDIGKIGIPDSILNKPSKLTDEEYAIMKSHVTRGAEILQGFTLVDHIVEGALYHHERYDGTGYAQGLKGEDIPLYARIIGVADAFDAMTANRVYSRKLDMAQAMAELERGRGSQFDPQMVGILLGLLQDGTIQVEKLYEESQSVSGI